LEEQIGACLVKREEPSSARCAAQVSCIFLRSALRRPARFGRCRVLMTALATGTEHRVRGGRAGAIAQRGPKAVSQADPSKKDHVGLSWINPGQWCCTGGGSSGWPVPAARLQGFDDREARQPPPAFGWRDRGAQHLAFQERGQGAGVDHALWARVGARSAYCAAIQESFR